MNVSSAQPIDGNALLRQFAGAIQRQLRREGGEIAHLKMTLDADESLGDLGVINLVRNDYVPELSQELNDPLASGKLIINIRAEVAPEILRDAVDESLSKTRRNHRGITLEIEHLEFFRPGKPVPTHRVTV